MGFSPQRLKPILRSIDYGTPFDRLRAGSEGRALTRISPTHLQVDSLKWPMRVSQSIALPISLTW